MLLFSELATLQTAPHLLALTARSLLLACRGDGVQYDTTAHLHKGR